MRKNLLKNIFTAVAVLFIASCATVRDKSQGPIGTSHYVNPVSDPAENVNRAVNTFNAGLNEHLVYPVSSLYRTAVPCIVRTGLSNMAKNLGYPVRAVSNCLQGKFSNAWNETKRFGINTTIGVLGFRDQAAAWNIQEHDEDLGQALAHYGVGPGIYLNLPVFGPCNVRDGVGALLGMPFNIFNWVIPDAAIYVNAGCSAVSVMESSPEIRRFFKSEYDSYTMTRAMYSLAREAACRDFKIPDDLKSSPDESLGYALVRPKCEFFMDWEYTHKVKLPGAERKLPYSCWLAAEGVSERRVMVILPGLGGHRLSNAVGALAEAYVNAGWSVIAFSSTMHPEYFRAMPGNDFPGNFVRDAANLDKAIACALADFNKRHPEYAAPDCSVLGYSLGAINAIFLADRETEVRINRIIAVNPPRNPLFALEKIDSFLNIPKEWGDNAETKVHELFLRIAASVSGSDGMAGLKLTKEESLFVIGLFMRLPLNDLVMAKLKDGVQLDGIPAGAGLEKTIGFSWLDYVDKVVIPAERSVDPSVKSRKALKAKCCLDAVVDTLGQDERIRLLHAENDFLLEKEDVSWFKSTLDERAVILPNGGHLGALASPDCMAKLLEFSEK